MSILRDFERRLEGAVEGFFARAFRSGLQPIELAKAVQRYAANYQQVGVDGVFIPNVYRFALARSDLDRFESYEDSLRRELAQVVTKTAAEREWQLRGPVQVDLIEGGRVRTGTYELRGKVQEGEDASGTAAGAPVPMAAAASAPPAGDIPGAQARVHEEQPTQAVGIATRYLVSDDGEQFPVGDGATIGRLPECTITLDDPAVSRRHARLVVDDGVLHVEDLGSTNGIKHNGEKTTRAVLRDGDRIDIGGSRLTFTATR